MKRRSHLPTRIVIAIAMMLTASGIHASENGVPEPEPKDTVLSNATRGLIESFGELSKTATKLSETAIKLLEAQEALDARKRQDEGDSQPVKNQTVVKRKGKKKNNGTAHSEPYRKEYGEEYGYDSTEEAEEEYTGPRVYIDDESETTAPRRGVYIGDDIQATESGQRVYISDDPQTAESGRGVYVFDETGYEETRTTPTDTLTTLRSIWDLQPEDGSGGHYVWVPDGTPEPVANTRANVPDINEKTFWRGDSIPMALKTKRFGRYDRKLYNWLIYPRGLWHISLSANYGELSTEDSEILSLMKDIDINGIIYSIKPSVSYFFRSNICAGVRLAFTKGEIGIDNFKVDIDEDMNFNLHDIKYNSESFQAAIFLQQYFGLSRRGRFAVFNEVEIAAGSGNRHFVRPFNGEMKDTRTRTESFNINYSPGVSIMVMKNAAFNLSFGIFGFHLQNEKQWENGEESGNRFTSGINFRFNIFNINFGASIII